MKNTGWKPLAYILWGQRLYYRPRPHCLKKIEKRNKRLVDMLEYSRTVYHQLIKESFYCALFRYINQSCWCFVISRCQGWNPWENFYLTNSRSQKPVFVPWGKFLRTILGNKNSHSLPVIQFPRSFNPAKCGRIKTIKENAFTHVHKSIMGDPRIEKNEREKKVKYA